MVLGRDTYTLFFKVQPENTITTKQIPEIPNIPSKSLLQGATLPLVAGKVAMFGEASMFTAQITKTARGTVKIGMGSYKAPYNKQFTLNVLHWLSGLLTTDESGVK
jgi:hypothetical protein